jgi:hypothetical protein
MSGKRQKPQCSLASEPKGRIMMLNEELSDLAILAAVADARAATRAAAKLGKSQSALSQSVRRLEERLKLRLLRGTRPPRNPPPFRRRAATLTCSSRHPATKRLPWNSRTTGILSLTLAAAISDISPMP